MVMIVRIIRNYIATLSTNTKYSIAAELVTPPLEDVILPGVTRDSVLALAREHSAGTLHIPGLPSKLTVSERHITMGEVKKAAESHQLLEVFGTGKLSVFCDIMTL